MSTSLSAQGDYGNGLLVLDNVSGAINEAAVSGDVNVDAKDGVPHLAGALALDELDLDPMAVALFGDSAFLADKNGAEMGPTRARATRAALAGSTLQPEIQPAVHRRPRPDDGGPCRRPVRHRL